MNGFPTKENPQNCRNECGAKIYLKKSGKMNPKTGNSIYLPYNVNDDTIHECNKKQTEKNNDISLEVVLKKLASIGITIDLEKLRNCK